MVLLHSQWCYFILCAETFLSLLLLYSQCCSFTLCAITVLSAYNYWTLNLIITSSSADNNDPILIIFKKTQVEGDYEGAECAKSYRWVTLGNLLTTIIKIENNRQEIPESGTFGHEPRCLNADLSRQFSSW